MTGTPTGDELVGVLRGLLMAVVAQHNAVEWVSVGLQRSMTRDNTLEITRHHGETRDLWRVVVHPKLNRKESSP